MKARLSESERPSWEWEAHIARALGREGESADPSPMNTNECEWLRTN